MRSERCGRMEVEGVSALRARTVERAMAVLKEQVSEEGVAALGVLLEEERRESRAEWLASVEKLSKGMQSQTRWVIVLALAPVISLVALTVGLLVKLFGG